MKKILVIDDDAPMRENTAEILSLANYTVFTAENGKTGIELAFREKPDLIICDINMPLLDGYGVLHLLQNNPTVRNTPFIFITGSDNNAEMRKCMSLGADDFIMKPFSETELLYAIEVRLKKQALLKKDLLDDAGKPQDTICAGSDRDILDLLTENRDSVRHKKKQVIYYESNHANRVFYIKKGKVKTFKTSDQGKELVVGLYKEGDYIGYVALLEGTTYTDTAEAIEDCELIIIPKKDFEELMHTRLDINRKFLTMLAHHVTERQDRLVELAYNSLRKKVASALLILKQKYDGAIQISRENIAAIAGTATESLIRTLSDFKKEKLIDIQNGHVVILNEKSLEKMIN